MTDYSLVQGTGSTIQSITTLFTPIPSDCVIGYVFQYTCSSLITGTTPGIAPSLTVAMTSVSQCTITLVGNIVVGGATIAIASAPFTLSVVPPCTVHTIVSS